MAPLECILIPVDGSVASQQAVDEGLELAAADGAGVVFAHVEHEPAGSWLVTPPAEPIPRPEVPGVLQQALGRAADAGVKATAEQIIGGRPAQELARLADDYDVDLIVLGVRDHSALVRPLLQHTSRTLLKRTNRPTLILHER